MATFPVLAKAGNLTFDNGLIEIITDNSTYHK